LLENQISKLGAAKIVCANHRLPPFGPWLEILEVENLVNTKLIQAKVYKGLPGRCLMLFKRFCTFSLLKQFTTFTNQQRRLISRFSWLWAEYDALAVARMKQWREIKSRTMLPKPDKISKGENKKRKRDQVQVEGSNEEVLDFEVKALLDQQKPSATSDGDATELASFPERFSEIELEIDELSSTGDGLAVSSAGDHVYVVPFSIPGDTVLAKVVQQVKGRPYSTADFVRVIKPSPKRNDAGIGCKYFSICSGCQLQMLPYKDQLAHKKTIIEKAYRNFSGLDPSQVPAIEDTSGSPLQYRYRTKLTPHFDGPGRKGDRSSKGYTEVPPIGFSLKGRSKVMDIENCPIGTDIVQLGLTQERKRVARDIATFKNGATILLRETTERTPRDTKQGVDGTLQQKGSTPPLSTTVIMPQNPLDKPTIRIEFPTYTETKTYIADMNGTSVEYIDDWKFANKAGAFFQNNNSILSPFTAYIRDNAIPPPSGSSTPPSPPIKYLLDAYCGSGLFAITLSSLFLSTLGIDIAAASVESARVNAVANNVTNAGFIEADASTLFLDVPFPAGQTLVVIDPPRKGASLDFLEQLMRFGPKRVVYVSCNVHTQARDVGVLVKGNGQWRYVIERVKGFDFFPQTGHVEGVAFLDREAVVKDEQGEVE
jgi:tRNA (uracil-5-)-methyltransferase